LASIADWKCIERVGVGATAEVWRAQNRAGTTAAIKVALGAAETQILEREAFRIQQIARRWGAKLLDAGPARVDEGVAFFLATTWIDGERLDPKKIPASKRVRIAAIVAHGVGRALAELHEAGVRHGDVKPDNVLMRRLGSHDRAEDSGCSLIDLGLATGVEEGARGGTQRYASPELRNAPDTVGPASDLFALGVMLQEILAEEKTNEPCAWAALLTARSPGARPSAAWIADRAAHFLELKEDPREAAESRRASVRRVYLSLRQAELNHASRISGDVGGDARTWLDESIALRRKIHQTPQNKPNRESEDAREIGAMSPLTCARFWVALVGTPAASWPIETFSSESDIVSRALDLATTTPLESWTYDDVRGAASFEPLDALPSGEERVAMFATELARPHPDARVVALAENEVAAQRMPRAIALALSDALARRGELGRAAYALSALHGAESDARRAEIARRSGDRETAEKSARRAIANGKGRPRDVARACLARLAWDDGHLDEALQAVHGARGAAAAEVRALVAYSSGNIGDGLREIEATEPRDVEELARLEAMRGMLEHARGESAASARAFGRASELATQSGSVVEEATYLTGLAAAATDDGDVGRALTAATRAALLWERLGRDANAARAWLSRASALATLGATHAADEAASEARIRSEASGDRRAAAYARWARVETRVPGDALAREESLGAFAELAGGTEEDLGRASARLLIWASGAIDETAILQADRASAGWSAGARWEWWGARATALDARANSIEAKSILTSLAALVGVAAPVGSRGPALAAAVKLATQLGEGDAARRFEAERIRASRRLRENAPAAFRSSIDSLSWAHEGETRDVELAPAQIAQLETIVRAFGGRDRLRPLFEQALDAMLLWAGVERGLLLLRAPDGKLVPRAARNLAREDLVGEQLALSHGIAQQALEKGDTVVATDAFASLGDLHASVHTLRLRSVLAVPLIARGETLGVVYLDDRTRRGAFGPRELAWVRLVASQAAMAIADARDQVLLRRAARRAEHARAELAEILSHTEAKLDAVRAELDASRTEDETRYKYDAIAGRSEPMRAMLRVVDRVTASDIPVLLIGESGTGKELVARALHANGPRAKRAFVSENCASVPESLLESTLFGHVKGAFTGASASRAGLFEIADGGTLFLDEIGEMSLGMQAKLLRVLQDGEVRAVGGERTRKVDVRIVAATHRDLSGMVDAGSFRQDLFYRLNVITVRVPALRERPEDVAALVHHFLEKHGHDRKLKITRAALDKLTSFSWPGNVRQLENEIRRAVVLSPLERIDVSELSNDVARGGPESTREAGHDLRSRVDALEADMLRDALEKTAGNQTRAAQMLGLSRFGLQKMMKRLSVTAK
jgi:transcriptional regulator with GAF, ATPase, and Fis domain/serine/threonine protein kinase